MATADYSWEEVARERDPEPGKYDANKSGFRTPLLAERDPIERAKEESKLARAIRDFHVVLEGRFKR